jgi:crotonobetainyl-CoA:carnitine CoA-transferase CaiB-like acyl-CoA transferase
MRSKRSLGAKSFSIFMTVPLKPTALSGLRILDLSRILAGPTATQLLADLGAEVIKIEKPESGDDTRGWGPPFLKDTEGRETRESAYYLSSNRGKHSATIDISTPPGQSVIKQMAETSDVLVENFKLGDLERYGLGYDELSKLNPRLIYCSISGFGRTGPNKHRAGYDFLIQAEGGLMSLTGDAGPMKAGVGVADVVCGLYATIGILAALEARHKSGRGQFIDVALMDAQVALLVNQGVAYLTNCEVPPRLGNDHPTIVPYGVFPASDGDFILAIGNDQQFQKFVALAEAPELAVDVLFAKNADRVRNRLTLVPILRQLTIKRSTKDWMTALEAAGVPAGPINTLDRVFESEQVASREMRIRLPHNSAETSYVDLIGNPLKFSATPVHYAKAPPRLGEDTDHVLRKVLGFSDNDISNLRARGALGKPR